MRNFSIKRPFGVELEVSNLGIKDNQKFDVDIAYLKNIVSKNTSKKVIAIDDWSQSVNNDYWHLKYDATCGEFGKGPGYPRGWEVASFKASGHDDLRHIAEVAGILSQKGIRVNDHCGLHVHADISDFSTDQASILAARWIKAEQWMKQSVPKSRRRNKYCKFLTSKKKYLLDYQYSPDEFWYLIRPINLGIHENAQKKVTLNFVNYVAYKQSIFSSSDYRPTVELRLPEGTLSPEDITQWVKLFLFLIESSKNASMPSTMAPEPSLNGALTYLGLRAKGVEKETRDWFLNRIIKFGQLVYIKKVKQWLSIENEEEIDI